MSPLKISIPEPCTQNWASMSPAEKGRYCNSCEKEVVDFRNWTSEELKDWFFNDKGTTCGLFFQEQITVGSPPVKKSRWSLVKGVFVASCLTLFASSKAYSKQALATVYEENKASKSNFTVKDSETDTLVTISGRVKDFNDKIDLLNVKVWTLSGQKTVTDAYGRFCLEAKVKKEGKVVLFFDYVGYRTKELVLNPGETENLKIELGMPEEQKRLVLGGAVLIQVKKPSFPKRVWNFIKRPFVKHH